MSFVLATSPCALFEKLPPVDFCEFICIYNINCVTLFAEMITYCFMKQHDNKFNAQYVSLMRNVALRIWVKGTQKECAEFLGISPANLSRILTCTVACQSTLFLRLLDYAGLCVFGSIRTSEGEIYPGVNPEDYLPIKY